MHIRMHPAARGGAAVPAAPRRGAAHIRRAGGSCICIYICVCTHPNPNPNPNPNPSPNPTPNPNPHLAAARALPPH
eukprot:scaffold37894_cov52-Phaeocystis_antarctica.AAC.2